MQQQKQISETNSSSSSWCNYKSRYSGSKCNSSSSRRSQLPEQTQPDQTQ
jgi:hypothetical protein